MFMHFCHFVNIVFGLGFSVFMIGVPKENIYF
jgi:hypothetical protein